MLRLPPLDNWDNPQADAGLLLFAQRLEECLFDYTLDSFRLPALTTLRRAEELSHAAEQCQRGLVRQEALTPIHEELVHSLRRDDAARNALQDLWPTYSDSRVWEKASVEDLRAHADVVVLRLEHGVYKAALIERLRQALADQEYGAIDAYAPMLAVELTQEGYSREYVFHVVRTFFFRRHRGARPISGVADFDRFLQALEASAAVWTVIIRASESVAVVQELFEGAEFLVSATPPAVDATYPPLLAWLEDSTPEQVFITQKVALARDAQGAHLRAVRFTELLAEYVRYHYHRQPVAIDTRAVVIPPNGRPLLLKAPKPATVKRPDPHRSRLGRSVVDTFQALGPVTLRGESTQRFLASLQMHGAAVQANTEEGQLLGLWSALESFLPMSRADAGIRRLKELAAPLLSIGYPTKILSQLHTAFRRTARGGADELLGPSAHGVERDFEHFIDALLELSRPGSCKDLLRLCGPNQLLRFRIESYARRFGTGEAILLEVQGHERRVAWHLSRIYRARNALIHEGRLHATAVPLIENLHDYYHQILDIVASTYARYSRPIQIDAVVLGLTASYAAYVERLRRTGRSPVSRDTARSLLWGVQM